MATPASLEANEIRRRGRRRLVGAVAIVVLLVVFVPMLLDSEPRVPRNQPELAIPPKDNPPPLPAPAPRKATEAPAQAAAPAQPAPAAPAAATPAPAAGQAPAQAPAAPATTATPQARSAAEPPPVARVTPAAPSKTPAASASPHLEGFAVQVGAFREEAKLKQARDKLAAAGVPHYTERLAGKQAGLTRLRAGPFKTRGEAEAALGRLQRASIKGQVVPLP